MQLIPAYSSVEADNKIWDIGAGGTNFYERKIEILKLKETSIL